MQPAPERSLYWQNVTGEHTSSPVLLSGAQHPLTHCEWVAHRAAQEMPVTVEFTHTAFSQQGVLVQLSPGVAHDDAQYFDGAQTDCVPSTSTVQHPLSH